MSFVNFFIVLVLLSSLALILAVPYDGTDEIDIFDPSGSEGCGCALTREVVVGIDGVTTNDFSKPELPSAPIKAAEIVSIKDQLNAKMVRIPGGKFFMGTDNPLILTDGESPRRPVTVSDFLMDTYEVSNEDYNHFVQATGYRTDSEIYEWSFVFESAIPPKLKKGISQAVLGAEWWLPVNGSYWREPEGPGSDVFESNRANYPAVHISWTDAHKFCEWRGARLPTE